MNWEELQKNGVTHLVLSPHELIEKLSALVPNAKMRSVIIPGLTRAQIKEKEKQEHKDSDESISIKKSSWLKLLARVFGVDVSKQCSLQWKNEDHSAGQRSTGDQKNPNPPRPLTHTTSFSSCTL